MTLLAEDLLLLLLDDTAGKLAMSSEVDTGLGGALLAELALIDAVEVVPSSSRWSKAKVQARVAGSAGDEELERALALVAERERTAQDLVGRLGKGVRDRLLERLEGRGLLRREEDRVLGLFPRTRWPAGDSTHEAEVRAAITSALQSGTVPEERTGALIAVLSAMDGLHKVVSVEGLTAREVRRRGRELAAGDWAAKGVQDAIKAAEGAMVAVLTTTTVTTAGSS